MHNVQLSLVDSKGNLECMRKVQKGKMEEVGMGEALSYEKWVRTLWSLLHFLKIALLAVNKRNGGDNPREYYIAVTIAQVTEAWIKAGAAEMMKSRNIRDINQSRRDMLCQPILLSWFHSLPPSVLPSWKTNQPLSFARAGSDCQLGCEGCSHLEWIPHAAQWEAEPSLCCSVSSTLHQNCFVCHQVIKVVDCSAASGNVVLKLGQQSLSLQ